MRTLGRASARDVGATAPRVTDTACLDGRWSQAALRLKISPAGLRRLALHCDPVRNKASVLLGLTHADTHLQARTH